MSEPSLEELAKQYEYIPESIRALLAAVMMGIEANPHWAWLDADARGRRAVQDARALVAAAVERAKVPHAVVSAPDPHATSEENTDGR